jgi:hypothetical protein
MFEITEEGAQITLEQMMEAKPGTIICMDATALQRLYAAAWALSHGWAIGGYDIPAPSPRNWYWVPEKLPSSDSYIANRHDFQWNGEGIPPMPDEVFEIVKKQMEGGL